MTIVKDMRYTIAAISLIAGVAVATAVLTKIDLLHPRHLDDVLIGLTLIFLGMAIDVYSRRIRHQREVEKQKLRTLKATIANGAGYRQ